MLTAPRDRCSVDSIQDLLVELFRVRDSLSASADMLADVDQCFICRKLSSQIGGNAADLQQIVFASGALPVEPRSDYSVRKSLSTALKRNGPPGVLKKVEHAERVLFEKYEQAMRRLDDPELTGLLEKQREDIEFADRVLSRLKALASVSNTDGQAI
jgi:hypothetical protein